MSGLLRQLIALAAMLGSGLTVAQVGSVGRDAAARIDYGWFTGDEGMILGAEDSLRNAAADPWHNYLLAYAAYRRAQHRTSHGQDAAGALDDCEARAKQAAGDTQVAAEALILRAACAVLAAGTEPLRAPLHQRLARQSLSEAQALDRDNPRLLLIALQYVGDEEMGVRPEPEQLLTAFRRESAAGGFPNWGEIEALTLLAGESLAAGNTRKARDLVEQALLIAPAYAPAVALSQRIAGVRADN